MGRKNLDRYLDADWRQAGETVGAIIANRWLVYSECDLCRLRIEADLKRIAEKRGMNFVLWGADNEVPADGVPGPGQLLVQTPWSKCRCRDDSLAVAGRIMAQCCGRETPVSDPHCPKADPIRVRYGWKADLGHAV